LCQAEGGIRTWSGTGVQSCALPFPPEFRRDTLGLCGSFFFCLLSVYMGVTWVPSMLAGTGFTVGTASYGLTAFNLGGVVGAIVRSEERRVGKEGGCGGPGER